MDNILEDLGLSPEVEKYLVSTFKELSVDDCSKNDIELKNEWELERFEEAGFIYKTKNEDKEYPYKVHQYVVTSQVKAIDLDNVAASYNATIREKDILRTNECIGSTDALYINNDKIDNCWYLIEFKNGEWDCDGIRKKMYDSITLLNNIYELDQHAILTSNRSKNMTVIDNLNLAENLSKNYGFEATAAFYKKRVKMLIVISGNKKIIKRYMDLCRNKDNYQKMEGILTHIDLKLSRYNRLKFNFGYDTINALANMLITANSANKGIIKYDGIMCIINRLSDMKLSKRIEEVLNINSGFISYLYNVIYADNKAIEQYKNKICKDEYITSENMRYIVAKASVRQITYDSKFSYNRHVEDDYQLLCDIADIYNLTDKQYSNFRDELNSILSKYADFIDIYGRKRLMEDNFCDFNKLLIGEEFEEALKRIVLVKRILSKRSDKFIGNDAVKKLLISIAGMDEQKACMISELCNKDMAAIYRLVAIWEYLYSGSLNGLQIRNGCYIRIIRQAKLIEMLNEDDETKSNKVKYGIFNTRIEQIINRCKIEDRQKAVNCEIKRIREALENGTEIVNILPLQMAVDMSIDKNVQITRRLKTMYKGSVLKDIDYCYGIDFEDVMNLHKVI